VAVDLRKVKKLIELVEESAIEELEVASGDESIRIVMHRGSSMSSLVTTAATPVATVADTPRAPIGTAGVSVKAPMAGTFYRASNPDAAPFVEVGQNVQVGDVLCIIESMKMMHEIRATSAGAVTEVCIDNAVPINTGDVLFTLS
jgi:acetyl-CoA carboxylase biotin carboxyl carrier protein